MIRARQRKQADGASESWHVVEHLHSSTCSQDYRRNRNLPGKNTQPLTKQLKLVWCAKDSSLLPISIRYNSALSLRPFYYMYFVHHAASGVFSWGMEFLPLSPLHSHFVPPARYVLLLCLRSEKVQHELQRWSLLSYVFSSSWVSAAEGIHYWSPHIYKRGNQIGYKIKIPGGQNRYDRCYARLAGNISWVTV